MNLSDFTRQKETNDAMLRELVDRFGGRLPGETLDDAVRRVRTAQVQYEQSIIRLRAAAEALRKQDEDYAKMKTERKVG